METIKKRAILTPYSAGLAAWVIVVGMLLSSCDSKTNLITGQQEEAKSSEAISGSELVPNITLLIKYDEKNYSFANQWPGDIVAGGGKAKDNDSDMLLETYENRRVRM